MKKNEHTISWYFRRIIEQKKPIRFIISRVLGKSKLCSLFRIKYQDFELIFFPSSLSMALWVDKFDRHEDVVIIEKILSHADWFIDVGANIGHLSIVGANIVGKSGKVYAIEPSPRIAEYCRNNILHNKLENIKVLNFAAGESLNILTLSENRADDMNHLTQKKNGLDVIVIPLDLIFPTDKIKLIKIDVEGWELFVMKGAKKLLSRTDFIYFEFWDEHTKDLGYNFKSIFFILHELGFLVAKINGKELEFKDSNAKFPDCTNLIAFRDTSKLVNLLN